MNGRRLVWAVIALLFAVITASADTFQDELLDELDRIGQSHYQHIVAGFGNFTYEYTGIGSSVARYLEDVFTGTLDQSEHFTIFVQDAIKNLDPEFEEAFGGLFNVENFEAIINGQYFDRGSVLEVQFDIISFRTGGLIGRGTLEIPSGEIPSGLSIAPPDVDQALQLRADLEEVLSSTDSGFVVRATTNRGDGAVFRDGEEMELSLYATQDAFVKVYHIDVHGNTQLIFPNRFHPENFIPAETYTQIPGPTDPFAFQLHEPYGTEYIQILASTEQFEDIEADFNPLGTASTYRTRGLSIVQRAGEVQEILLNYTIVAE